MATTTVPTTIKQQAVEMARELGVERELEAILEEGRRTVKGLRSLEVDADMESSMGPEIIIWAKVDPDSEGDPSHLAWWSWRIERYGPDVAADFCVAIEPDLPTNGR
jgi:hypothetical protein